MPEMQFLPVEPPAEAPIQSLADQLGLPAGLRVEKHECGYRCAGCSTFQAKPDYMVWVPDGVRKSDSAEAVTEQCRRNAYNGEHSGWCISCCTQWKTNKPLGSVVRESVLKALLKKIAEVKSRKR